MGLLSAIPNVYDPKKVIAGAAATVKSAVPTPKVSTGTQTTLAGPYIQTSGQINAGNTVTLPTPTPAKTTVTPVQNVTVQGPYINPANGQIQQGANVVDGKIQYNQPASSGSMTQAIQSMPTYVPPASTGLNYDQATSQVRGQIDPMFARALDALQAQKYQDQLNSDELGMARGGAHSGLAADLQNKVAIGAAGKAADLDATRQTQIAQMAQDLVNRGQDNDFRNQQQKLAEFLGIGGLNLQQQGQQADYTGIFNGKQTMQSQNQNFQQGIQRGDLTGWYEGLQTLAGQNQGFNQSMQNKQFDYTKGVDDRNYNQNQQVIDYNQSASNPTNQGQILQNTGQGLQNKLSQLQLNDYPAQAKAAAQKTQQDLAAGKISNEVAQYQFDELKNPNSAVNVAQTLSNKINQINLENLPREKQLEIQRMQKEIQQIGVVHTTKQSQTDIEMDNLKLDKLKADIEKVKADTNVKNEKGVVVNVKTSADNYGLLTQDVADSKDLAEAYNLIEQNADELTDADYKQLKEDARKKFEKPKY